MGWRRMANGQYDPVDVATSYTNSMRSWGAGFKRAVRSRRMALRQITAIMQYLWLRDSPALDKGRLMAAAASRIDRHANHLSAEAISYRRALGRATVNGFFVQ